MIIRPIQRNDIEGVFDVIQAASAADWSHRVARSSIRGIHDSEHTTAVVMMDRRPVGFAWWELQNRPDGDFLTFEGWVHPNYRRRGVGTGLLVAAERAAVDFNAAQMGGASVYDSNPDAVALYRKRGFENIRNFHQMWGPLAAPDAYLDLPPPSGITIRPYRESDVDALVDAERDAYAHHWGVRPGGITADQIRQRIEGSLDFDPARFLLAFDGDQVVAFVLAEASPLNGPANDAWLWHVGTRQAYQRRGLAKILMHRCFALLSEQGFQRAGLHVDEGNPAAIALYRSMGLEVVRNRVHFMRRIR